MSLAPRCERATRGSIPIVRVVSGRSWLPEVDLRRCGLLHLTAAATFTELNGPLLRGSFVITGFGGGSDFHTLRDCYGYIFGGNVS